jgi:two-component system, chemotaxis family, protein-glutamate methylesterase/glutaminase
MHFPSNGTQSKPGLGVGDFLEDSSDDLIAAVKAAARTNMGAVRRSAQARKPLPEPVAPRLAMAQTTERIIAIGTSTGGTMALEELLTALPRVCPGMLIVQHMPALSTAAFASRLDGLCDVTVKEAQDGQRVLPGLALIAPGGKHMQLVRSMRLKSRMARRSTAIAPRWTCCFVRSPSTPVTTPWA